MEQDSQIRTCIKDQGYLHCCSISNSLAVGIGIQLILTHISFIIVCTVACHRSYVYSSFSPSLQLNVSGTTHDETMLDLSSLVSMIAKSLIG